MDEVKVYILHINVVKENYSFLMSFVDSSRKEKTLKYKTEKDQLLSLGAGYLIKEYLPNKLIKETHSGKPYIDGGPYFNISHSGDYVAIAIHPSREVGIDIQKIDESKTSTIKYVLNEEEKHTNNVDDLFRLWTNKESLIKCVSSGLKDIKEVSALPLEGARAFDNEDYYTTSVVNESYSLSVTLKNNLPFILNIKQIDSLK